MISVKKKSISLMICLSMIASVFAMVISPSIPTVSANYDWGSYLKKSTDWYGSSEAIALADDIVKYQLSDGGWKKNMSGSDSGSWGKSTTDNDATTSQITILARVYKQTQNSKYLDSCRKGIDLLINGQYSNGGWPQVFNDAGTYHAHITYNDGAMIRVMHIMKAVSERSGDFSFIDSTRASKATTATEKGIQCILNTQIVANGINTAWCQQHDEFTLKPTAGRSYELASISASESVGVVNFLKSIQNPSVEIVKSINAAVTWMTQVQIHGIKVVNTDNDRIVVEDSSAPPIWARFYEIGTNKPMFVDRDGSIHDNMAALSQERRTGYAWYGNWPRTLVSDGLLPLPEEPILEPLNGTLIKNLDIFDTNRYSSWDIKENLQLGDAIYGDRANTFTDMPDALAGVEWIKLACDSKDFTSEVANFTAGKAISVFIGLDTRVSPTPEWMSDWSNTGATIDASNDVIYNIYQKDFSEGSIVSLGSNGPPSGVVMYTVFVARKDSVSFDTTESGDINGDGVVNHDDANMLKSYLLNKTSTLTNPQDADLNSDGIINMADYVVLNRSLLY